MSITVSFLGLELHIALARPSDPELPPMEANGAGQFELAPQALWAADEFGFRNTP